MSVVGPSHIFVGRIPAAPTATVSSSKAPVSVTRTEPPKAVASQSTSQDISSGLMWSVNQPAAGNHLATADFLAMRNDLDAGNLSAAQQAYLRMQNDLQIYQASASAVAGVLNQLA